MAIPPNTTTPNRQSLLYSLFNTLICSGSESGSNLDRGVLNPSPCKYQIYTDINSLACEMVREVQPNIPLASKNLGICLSSKSLNIPLNVCTYSTEKTYSTRDVGTQTARKRYSESSTLLLPDYKKYILSPSGIEPATDVLGHTPFQPYYLPGSSYCQVRVLHT